VAQRSTASQTPAVPGRFWPSLQLAPCGLSLQLAGELVPASQGMPAFSSTLSTAQENLSGPVPCVNLLPRQPTLVEEPGRLQPKLPGFTGPPGSSNFGCVPASQRRSLGDHQRGRLTGVGDDVGKPVHERSELVQYRCVFHSGVACRFGLVGQRPAGQRHQELTQIGRHA
jgi:hypothetical protein